MMDRTFSDDSELMLFHRPSIDTDSSGSYETESRFWVSQKRFLATSTVSAAEAGEESFSKAGMPFS